MTKTRLAAALLAVALGLLLTNQAEARRKMVLKGEAAKQNAQKVNRGIEWHTSLRSALSEARKQEKMVLWVHMIGKIDGAT